MQKTMRAAIFNRFGGPEVLQFEEVSIPNVGPEEVLVRVRAVALNRRDLEMQAGLTKPTLSFPHIGGSEIAGEVALLGEKIRGFELGQPVVVTSSPLNRLNDQEEPEVATTISQGGFAEYVNIPSYRLVKLPEELSFEEGAAQAGTTIIAWHGLVSKAGVRPGEMVLVLAAGSGVGSAAIQISKLWGAQVIAAAGTTEKLAKAEEAGADYLINYNDTDFAEEVRKITNQRGTDIVVESLGQETWNKSLESLATGGRLVACGAATGGTGQLSIIDIFSKEIMILGSNGGTAEELKEVLHFTAEGRLSATIDSVFTFDQIKVAQEKLLNRQQYGKIIITL